MRPQTLIKIPGEYLSVVSLCLANHPFMESIVLDCLRPGGVITVHYRHLGHIQEVWHQQVYGAAMSSLPALQVLVDRWLHTYEPKYYTFPDYNWCLKLWWTGRVTLKYDGITFSRAGFWRQPAHRKKLIPVG